MGSSPAAEVIDDARTYPRLLPAGDSGILIELGSEIDPVINSRVLALTEIIETVEIAAVIELVPTYRSVLVSYNPLETGYEEMLDLLNEILDRADYSAPDSAAQTIVEIPVVYGGEGGPDLETVAEHAGLSIQEVIDIHTGTDYPCYGLGFSPGFPYLGGLDERIATPRLKTPRVRVPAGSVAIAESQTGVYPNASPGGWQLIGRTATPLFDVNKPSPSLVTAGDRVRFVQVQSHA
jgi:inhibitor of KinA